MLPGTCPACGEWVEAGPAPAVPAAPGRSADRVVSSRLNQTAAVGGVMIAGLVTGAVSWFLVGPEMGAGLLLLALLVAAGILWRS